MVKLVAVSMVVGSIGLLVAATACEPERPACYEGDFISCSCANGARGYAKCQPNEGLYVPCICDGTTPGAKPVDIDAGETDASAEASSSKRGFLEPCTTNDDCASGRCQEYPGKGTQLCTNACTQATAATDCPPPSTGCNNQGVCKAP